jgi:allantoin racemase
LTYKLAETMLALQLSHSRACYPKPLEPRIDMLHAMLEAAAKVARP